jgi:hypothetical protein
LLNETRMRTFLPIFGIALLVGCTGDLVELNPGQDLAFGAAVDMAQGGGGELGPNTTHFVDIQADLDGKGCTLTACHGGMNNGSIMYVKAMATGADLDANYANVVPAETGSGDQSALLRNPLVGSGSGHAGTTPFANMQDPTYQKWLAWINAGAPK